MMIIRLGAAEEGSEPPAPIPDEVLGLEKFANYTEDAVKKAAVEFVAYLAESGEGPLPPEARKLLEAAQADTKPKAAAAQPQNEEERLQKKLQERKEQKEKEETQKKATETLAAAQEV